MLEQTVIIKLKSLVMIVENPGRPRIQKSRIDMLSYHSKLLFIFLLSIPLLSLSQLSTDHWETVVFNDDTWAYELGSPAIRTNWMLPQFDDSDWRTGPGGFGYSDGDDNTLIPTTLSVYIRIKFTLSDTSKIKEALLHADYDDAFVAYWNGLEFARGNFGAAGTPPDYDDIPATDHEAALYAGGLPEAFSIDPRTFDQLAKQGENTLAIQIHNRFITSSDLSSNFFLSLGINDTSREYEATPSWFFEPFVFTSTHLPLIRINTLGGTIVDEPKIIANMQIVNNGSGMMNALDDAATDYDGQIAIEIRGASSQLFDKKNYGFETQLPNGDNNNVSLLGMPAENDWVLHGPYTDKSLIRNALSFQIGRDMMDYASRTVFCDLVINGNYRGIYLLMEKIKRDRNRVDIAKLRPEDIVGDELTGGYIVQIDRDNPNTEEDGWYSPFGSNPFYAFHSPSQNQLMPEQKQYIRTWITDFERAMLRADIETIFEDYIDVGSFIDYFLINELSKHIDAFKLSFYMYKEKDSDGGKLHMGPIWDFNLGYGNFDFGCNPQAIGWIYPCTSRAFWLSNILNISSVQDRMYCRWESLRQGVLSNASLMNRIDSIVNILGPAVDANFAQFNILGQYIWPNFFVGNTHNEEIVFLKNWLTQRLIWMDANMFGDPRLDCDLVLNNSDLEKAAVLKVYPNPFSHQITFSLENPGFQEGEVFIFDILGNPISHFTLRNQHTLEVESFTAGMYFYEYRKGTEILQQGKILK